MYDLRVICSFSRKVLLSSRFWASITNPILMEHACRFYLFYIFFFFALDPNMLLNGHKTGEGTDIREAIANPALDSDFVESIQTSPSNKTFQPWKVSVTLFPKYLLKLMWLTGAEPLGNTFSKVQEVKHLRV